MGRSAERMNHHDSRQYIHAMATIPNWVNANRLRKYSNTSRIDQLVALHTSSVCIPCENQLLQAAHILHETAVPIPFPAAYGKRHGICSHALVASAVKTAASDNVGNVMHGPQVNLCGAPVRLSAHGVHAQAVNTQE